MAKNFKFKNGKYVICEDMDAPQNQDSFKNAKNAVNLMNLIADRTKMPNIEIEQFFDKIFEWGKTHGIQFDEEKFAEEVEKFVYRHHQPPPQADRFGRYDYLSTLTNKEKDSLTDPRVGPNSGPIRKAFGE